MSGNCVRNVVSHAGNSLCKTFYARHLFSYFILAYTARPHKWNRAIDQRHGMPLPTSSLQQEKLHVSHLRAFGAPCAIVEPNELLKKLDHRAKMCFFRWV